MSLLVGCAGFPVDEAEYASALSFVEVQETFDDTSLSDELASWPQKELSLGLVASKVITHPRSDPAHREGSSHIPEHAAIGHFARSRWTDEAWEAMDALARRLRASVILFRSPPSFRKTKQNVSQLENFIAHGQRAGLSLAWQSPASWPEAEVKRVCEHLGMVHAVDPTVAEIPAGEEIYLRFEGGRNGRSSPSEAKLVAIAEAARSRSGHVVFANASAWEDARRFLKIL